MKHLIFSSKLIAILFVVSSMMYIGCQKEEVKSDASSLLTSKRSITDNLPTPINGVIKFNDYNEYKSTYLNLQTIFENDQELFKSSFETSQGFLSVYSKLQNDEFISWDYAYKPFITDPILMVILNEYYEFQVGDALITYINNEDIITSKANDNITRNQIRQIIKGEELNLQDVPTDASWGKDTNESSYKLTWCGCEIEIEQLCNRVRIFGKCKNLVGNGEGTVSISQNNGTPEVHRIVGNFEFFLTPNGPTRIDAEAIADCFASHTVFDVLNFDPELVTCDKRERDSGWLWSFNGIEAMRNRVKYYHTFNTRWASDIESVSFSNGKWRSSKSNRLECSIDATTRGVTCNVFRTEKDFDSCKNCKSEGVGVNNGLNGGGNLFRHCDGDIFGVFKKVKNGITLTRTVSIDFDCCL